jgi:hypothetical protein
MSELFEIVIFTASVSKYALPIINFIDKENKCEFKLFREHCSIFNNGFTKDLKRLSRDLNNLIILDNNPNSFFLNKENGLPIKTWIDDTHDKELFKIMPYLKFLASEKIKDVRPILTKIKRGNEINYYYFDKIIRKYHINLNNSDSNKHILIEDKNEDKNNEEKTELNNNEKNEKNDLDKSIDKNNKKLLIKIKIKENDKDKKNENNEEKNNYEKNDLNLENKVKIDFENKLKSSKENLIHTNKYNYSENKDINISDNIFNKKNRLDAIYSSKFNMITPTRNIYRKIFSNNNFNKTISNNISSIKNEEKDNLYQIKLKPISTKYLNHIINPIYNSSSQYNESPDNKEEKKQYSTIFNECNKKSNFLGSINDVLPSIKNNNQSLLMAKDNIKMIKKYSDYYRTINNYKKNNDTKDSKRINYFSLSKMNMNRSNSENNSLLIDNCKQINNQKINLNSINEEELLYKRMKKWSNDMQFNRTLSISKTPKKYMNNILNYRNFSSRKKIINNNNETNNNDTDYNTTATINVVSNTKYENYHKYHLNKIQNFRKENKNIFLINKTNFINKSDLNPINDSNKKITNNNLDNNNIFAKNINLICKKRNIFI